MMLQSFYIKSLFGLYTYDLKLANTPEDTIRFITGPNGYGKTTILNILNALYTYDIKALSEIHFDSIALTYDDGTVIDVRQNRVFSEESENQDERQCLNTELDITFYSGKGKGKMFSLEWNSNEGESGQELGNLGLSLFFSSYPVYYIQDKRMYKAKRMPTVAADAESFAQLLRDKQNEILTNDNKETQAGEPDAEKLQGYVEVLRECRIISEDLDRKIIDRYVSSHKDFIERLSVFINIIRKSAFANKRLQIDPRYGYRFIALDEDGTILSADKLSSGEQQILILAYELLFEAADDSIVLIDEPELSFHLAWQGDFLDNLRWITDLRPIQCIVATHSPQIFKSDWDLSVDLFECQIDEHGSKP